MARLPAEDVIAIGWEGLNGDPSTLTDGELRKAVEREYPDVTPDRIARKIRTFVDLGVGDKVLICRGYPPKSNADVHIYGIARVAGKFFDDRSSSWWRFKRPAVIQVIDAGIPRQIIAEALMKQSLRETIHKLEPSRFMVLVKALRERLGVTVIV